MGYALHRIPEQPTQPPELPHDVELAYWSIYRETHKHEAAAAHFVVRRILSAGEGQLDSVTEYGAYVAFDAGDIWDALTESEESADLSILVGAVIASGVTNVVARAQARSEEHTSELQSLMRISYAVLFL